MQLTDLPVETLRAELAFVKPMLETTAEEAAKKWVWTCSPICSIDDCSKWECPLKQIKFAGAAEENLCSGLCSDDISAAKEYITALEAAIREKEGAADV